jgi:hypothetical protein
MHYLTIMICEIETAVAAYITQGFAALVPPRVTIVVPATRIGDIDGTVQRVIAKCVDAPHLGLGMYDAVVQITVETPLIEGVTLASHVDIERDVRALFPADNADVPPALDAAVRAAVAGCKCCGYFSRGQQPGSESTGFVPYYEVVVGIDPLTP